MRPQESNIIIMYSLGSPCHSGGASLAGFAAHQPHEHGIGGGTSGAHHESALFTIGPRRACWRSLVLGGTSGQLRTHGQHHERWRRVALLRRAPELVAAAAMVATACAVSGSAPFAEPCDLRRKLPISDNVLLKVTGSTLVWSSERGRATYYRCPSRVSATE